MPDELHLIFNRARLDDRQINELMGLARGITADGVVNQVEIEYLQKWLVANIGISGNPIISNLLQRVNTMLADNVLDEGEAIELFDTLQKYSGGDFEIGELLKATTLPLDDPAPQIGYPSDFCFTGTFAFGSRKDCEEKVELLGGRAGSLTRNTDYLVIGIYATDSWVHSSYGRKIEKTLELRASGTPIKIIGERHWISTF
jgi:hypothetical protein